MLVTPSKNHDDLYLCNQGVHEHHEILLLNCIVNHYDVYNKFTRVRMYDFVGNIYAAGKFQILIENGLNKKISNFSVS